MMYNYFYKLFFVFICCFPILCSGNQQDIIDNVHILKSIKPNLSERKLNQLIMFDSQLSFISAFSHQNNSNGLLPSTINISNILQNVLNRIDNRLVIASQRVVDSQLPNNFRIKSLKFNILAPTANNGIKKEISLSILIFSSNNDPLETYLMAEREFLFSLFPTPFPNPDVKNINNLGTAAAKIFPQESNNFVWTYKNIFCSVENSSTFPFQLSVKIAQELQEELKKMLQQ